ncbi:hypothetical protein CHLNCDRAFT_17797, partial [Chlorella variabilis]
NGLGTVGGIESSSADKAFNILASLGNLAFAFGFVEIIMEIQDTLRQPPPATPTMRKAINIGVSMAGTFYLLSSVVCYLSFGNDVPGNVLEGF